MQTWQKELDFDFSNPLIHDYFTENALFFDIETTGFSPAHTSLYLIGCAMRKGNTLIIEQFFADEPSEEKDVLLLFFRHLSQYETVITFNGIGFDIPYLKAKCAAYEIEEPFSAHTYLDIYKVVSKLKFLFQLPNLKQKSIEHFLGIGREDLYHGGELIEVYHAYVKSPNQELLSLLKQHNYEDVLDMPHLLPVLAYSKLFEGDFSVSSLEANQYTSFDGTLEKELILTLQTDAAVPVRVSCRHNDFYLVSEGNTTKLVIHLFEGELKYFFSDYQNYYYLPEEDLAVPKSITSAVEKTRRKKATAATCYTRKYAIFLPQYAPLITPAFRAIYRDKKSFFELSEDFAASPSLQKQYAKHILDVFFSKKR